MRGRLGASRDVVDRGVIEPLDADRGSEGSGSCGATYVDGGTCGICGTCASLPKTFAPRVATAALGRRRRINPRRDLDGGTGSSLGTDVEVGGAAVAVAVAAPLPPELGALSCASVVAAVVVGAVVSSLDARRGLPLKS